MEAATVTAVGKDNNQLKAAVEKTAAAAVAMKATATVLTVAMVMATAMAIAMAMMTEMATATVMATATETVSFLPPWLYSLAAMAAEVTVPVAGAVATATVQCQRQE
jgi:hypothetical protein